MKLKNFYQKDVTCQKYQQLKEHIYYIARET